MARKRKPHVIDKDKQTPYAGCLEGIPQETAPHVLVSGPTGRGKALVDHTMIPVADLRRYVPIGQLDVGDKVLEGVTGKPTEVVGVYPQGPKPVFRLRFEDGSTVDCCEEHLWNVRDGAQRRAGEPFETMSLREIIAATRTGERSGFSVPAGSTREGEDLLIAGIHDFGREEEMTCIEVAAESQLFQAGMGHIVTHNTTRVLAPAALLWQGPRVVVSSKTDYLKWLITKGVHQRGPVYIMDLAGELDPSFDWLQGVDYSMVTSDPCHLIANDDDALAMASLLMKVGSLGASGSAEGGGGSDAFWQTQAAQPMAALLQAGKAQGDGISWALRAVDKFEKDSDDDTSPSWANAFEYVANASFHAQKLLAVTQMDGKLRDSVKATMLAGLTPWALTNVRGFGHNTIPFTPKMMEGPDEPTLAIIAPSDGVAAGAAVGAIETIVRHWRRGIEYGLDRVLCCVDELVNTAPLPALPQWVTEARGLGVAFLCAVQSTNQMKLRWGEDGAEVLREVFPAHLILEGAPEKDLLEAAAWWDGEKDVARHSHDAQARSSISYERVPVTNPTDLLPKSVEEGRLLRYGKKGYMVDLPGIWRFGAAG